MNEETMNEETQSKTFIDRDSLIKRRYREGEVTTSLDRVFKIKAIDPKVLLITKGTGFLPAFNEFLDDPSPTKVGDPQILDFISQIVLLNPCFSIFVHINPIQFFVLWIGTHRECHYHTTNIKLISTVQCIQLIENFCF